LNRGIDFTAEPQRTQRKTFLFGGEIPPNKKVSALLPKGWSFFSNRHLPIGEEEKNLCDLRDSAVNPGLESGF
jgi:hypothetical protein